MHSTGKLRLPNGTLVSYERRIIEDASTTTVYKGNPRFGKSPDVTSLRKKLKQTRGNILPVSCRIINGVVEVIDGSRRRLASAEEGLPLLCDVITEPVSDDIALQLAFMANQERDDPDVFEEAYFFVNAYENEKEWGSGLTIESFADKYGMSRQNMHRYFSISKVPEWVCNLCQRFKSDLDGKLIPVWSLRKAGEVESLVKEISRLDDEALSEFKNRTFAGPEEVIRGLRKALLIGVKNSNVNKIALSDSGKGIGELVLGKRKATLKLVLSENASEELKGKIIALLKEHGAN
jgi:ParB/RepB/Spo0J family partition protein